MQKKRTSKKDLKFPEFLIDASKLRWTCPEDVFDFKSTAELKPLDRIVGQERAIEAIRMGAELKAKGYNIFVTGLSGTGRTTTVKQIVEDNATSCPITYDYCYVNNFDNPDNPILLTLPKGNAKILSNSMDEAISFLRVRLPKLFEEEAYQIARKKIIDEYQQKERESLNDFDKKIKPLGFIRGQLENEQGFVQPEVFPLIDGEPVAIETLDELAEQGKLTKKKVAELKKTWKKLHDEVFELSRISMKLIQEFRKDLLNNDKMSAETVVISAFSEVETNFANHGLDNYLIKVKEFILDNLNIFVPAPAPVPVLAEVENKNDNSDFFNQFKVNVILDNTNTVQAPVVIETTPTYNNLFGTIEKTYDQRGFWKTDFTKIKSGSLLKADQGFLIVNAIDLYTEPGVWSALKRVLLYDKLEIQPYDSYFQISQSSIKPEPIQINVKVIVIGGQTLYKWLFANEKEFKKIFKVNAQFDYESPKSVEMLENYARFIAKLSNEEELTHCSPSGVAAVIEWAVEEAGSQNKIILKFSDVSDLLREASFYSRDSKIPLISREDVQKAIDWRKKRNDLIDEKLQNEIIEGTILIDTEGEKVGIINGLTIYNNGIFAFGKPARISANVSAGTSGIINIEREADMSGKIHNKGVLIISGFLREKFARKTTLSLTASLAFEQNYGGIDGDSASAAEIYAILSALTEKPIKQEIAITGSMNQKGDIQPIGGVNEKITGFYEICKSRGLTGNQGCIIPKTNVKDLMLNNELISDCKAGKFHIWAISNIDDGVEILFGIAAGKLSKDGNYTKDSLYAATVEKLNELVEIVKPKKNINAKSNTKKTD
ncbi:MAG: AAA family ATPase [Candidatus Kapabacteria bacterium]|nr:AAA family ATPase [Ignavibacteriota bacterium]MCW5884768.1 AAA family ATPase [Candidatus Kapabacteria bacterium]